MAKYQKYAEYKDSGEDWLGEIPVNWDLKKHKYIAIFSKGKNPDLLVDQYSSGLYPYLSMDSLRGKSESKYAEYKKGLVLVKDNQPLIIWDGSNSGEFVLGKKGILSSTMASASLVYEIDNKFYWYTCICIEPEMRKHATGMGIPHVNGDELRSISLPLPNLNEQEKIANFLDHETAKIDILIAKQEKLIELLKEKRQAVISHAVTKGLNPNVPMKDSGVEWLGEVPEHWRICRLKHVGYIQSGIAKGKDLTGKTSISVPMLRVANVQDGYLNLDEVHQIDIEPEQLERYLLQNGDVLMNEGGDNDKLGRGAVWRNEIKNCIHQNHVFAIRTTVIEPEWLDILTRASYAKFHFFRQSKQSTNLASISATNIKETPILVPPNNEREQILGYLNRQFNQFSKLENRCYQQVELLKERRTALISAAVTGKIDVRHWQNPNKNKEADMELSA